MLWSLYRQCRHKPFLCSLSSIVHFKYRMNLVSTVSTLHSDGFLSSGIEDFLLKPPCIDSVDITFGWIPFIRYWRFSTQTTLYRQCRHYIRMDSFHPVLKIFYSNHLVSTVSTNIKCIACFDLCIDSVDISPFFALCLQ